MRTEGMSDLATHLLSTGISQADFAKRLGISRSHMSELVSGAKTPSLQLAFEIERETGGSVLASSWVSTQQKAS